MGFRALYRRHSSRILSIMNCVDVGAGCCLDFDDVDVDVGSGSGSSHGPSKTRRGGNRMPLPRLRRLMDLAPLRVEQNASAHGGAWKAAAAAAAAMILRFILLLADCRKQKMKGSLAAVRHENIDSHKIANCSRRSQASKGRAQASTQANRQVKSVAAYCNTSSSISSLVKLDQLQTNSSHPACICVLFVPVRLRVSSTTSITHNKHGQEEPKLQGQAIPGQPAPGPAPAEEGPRR